jgi:hypothetical protein
MLAPVESFLHYSLLSPFCLSATFLLLWSFAIDADRASVTPTHTTVRASDSPIGLQLQQGCCTAATSANEFGSNVLRQNFFSNAPFYRRMTHFNPFRASALIPTRQAGSQRPDTRTGTPVEEEAAEAFARS